MTLFLLRDDDANATTDPARLARVYAPLLDAGLPLALSVIPEVALDTRAPDGSREAFVDASIAPSPDTIALTPASPLASFVRENSDVLDVLQHGTTHARVRGNTEYGALSEAEATARLARGKATLTRALGAAPVGFVAPWDRLSAGSLAAVARSFPLLSTHWLDRSMLPARAWPAHLVERARRSETLRLGACRVVRHRGGRIAGSTRAEEVRGILDELTRDADVAVIVLHHWMYWDVDVHPAIVALASELRRRGRVARASVLPSLLGERARPTDHQAVAAAAVSHR